MNENMDMDGDGDREGLRGVKRKADDAPLPVPEVSRRIRALDQDVVNKIAAGEIIVAPVHALKELIENAVDAGSTSLEIVVKEGGLKLLQITDNGHGIDREDLPILCERFTTSKLKAFEDLTSIGTYGFRGEALASISHIAHLTVTTKTKDSNCAWRAHYSDGKLVPAKPGQNAKPKATAGRGGTQITVEDLFYNIPTRRRAFRSASEEYAKVLDMVGRYAVHCSGVAFSCKKHGESTVGIATPGNATTVDRIRQIHGSSVANELIRLDLANGRLGFTVDGFASNANYHAKRMVLLLFINHRAVESSAIKKAVEQCYSTFLPKGSHPFIYLSLEIEPERVDVNVHPTKKEVHFLNEDEIIEAICDEIRAKLADVDTSRTFMTQSLLPGARMPVPPGTSNGLLAEGASKGSTQKPYENNLVRTDSRMRKITSMLPPGQVTASEDVEDLDYEYIEKEPTVCRLTTVKQLRAEVREGMHNELTEVFAGHTFVGIVDERRRIAAIQGGVKLYLVDYGMMCEEFFYQLGLTDFGNFGRISFDPPLSLTSLLETALRHELSLTPSTAGPPLDWTHVLSKVRTQLLDRREMLDEYFSLSLSASGDLHSIPLLLKGYTPSLAHLPRFLLHLGPNVHWRDEKKCFATFLRELAAFYAPEPLPPLSSRAAGAGADADADADLSSRRATLARVLENMIFPAVRAKLVATTRLMQGGGVVEVANLKGLYRVFERC
ncbi:MAG: DNA mismatch repair protein [Thelocarpon impressellum]|nr:MAG: DNA mismatch repair protein [Thelocarpon impressellum]